MDIPFENVVVATIVIATGFLVGSLICYESMAEIIGNAIMMFLFIIGLLLMFYGALQLKSSRTYRIVRSS